MKKFFWSVLSIALLSGIATKADSKTKNDGFVIEISNPDSEKIKELVKKGQLEILNLSFGIFGHIRRSQISSFNLDTPAFYEENPIASIEPNVEYRPLDIEIPAPSIQDIDWSHQWAFNNTGKNNWAGGPKGEDVHALDAWKINQGSKDIIIAVIDSGAKIDHPDLVENIYTNQAELNGVKGVDDDNNGFIDDIHGWDFANNDADPDDEVGHGTHVAGLIGASHNSIGIAGMMAHVQIMPLKFLSKNNKGDTKNALLAFDYAIKMGAKIINISWGSENQSELMQKAIRTANDKGILVVAAAGNSQKDNAKSPIFPASYQIPNIISVGATDGNGDKASFSNWGKSSVHIFAPGVYLISVTPNNDFTYQSGTSMAAPLVTGALGLLFSQYPTMDIQTAKQRLMDTSDNKEKYSDIGLSGRLNAYQLLAK
ncbi:MAG: S8 family peptidase [Pseudobdellovibrionaceae bacterium]